jgi:hypothetical protein
MEFLADLLVSLLQFLCELLFQIFGEAIVELGWHSLREVFRPSDPSRRIFALCGFGIVGAALGALSLLVFPRHFAIGLSLRWTTLLVGPVVSAVAILPITWTFPDHFESATLRQRLASAYVVALAISLVRFAYAQ